MPCSLALDRAQIWPGLERCHDSLGSLSLATLPHLIQLCHLLTTGRSLTGAEPRLSAVCILWRWIHVAGIPAAVEGWRFHDPSWG